MVKNLDSTPYLEAPFIVMPQLKSIHPKKMIKALKKSGEIISKILVHLGGESLSLELKCSHDPYYVRNKEYSQEEFFRLVDGVDIHTGESIGGEQPATCYLLGKLMLTL